MIAVKLLGGLLLLLLLFLFSKANNMGCGISYTRKQAVNIYLFIYVFDMHRF